MEPLVVDYLRHHSFKELEDNHGVCARPSNGLDKFSLNYDQLAIKKGDLIAEQCRGLVIRPREWQELARQDAETTREFGPDSIFSKTARWRKTLFTRGFDVLAWPMNRFYNHGDSSAAAVDWSDPGLRVYEKLDGTMIVCYWDPIQDRWHAATRGVPEADLPICKDHLEIGNTTYSQLFKRALIETRESTSGQLIDWHITGFEKVIHLNKELTYVFELVSPWNQVVVYYPTPRVYLLAARHTVSGLEVAIESLRMQHVLRPQTWAIHSAEALAAFVDSADPSKLEGAVAKDSADRRIKVKNITWVLASRSKDTVTASPRSALECIIKEKIDDIVPLVPKDVGDKLLRMQGAYLQFCKSLDDNVKRFKVVASGSRKAYAEQVMASGDWSAPYFPLWEGKANSTREWIKVMCDKEKLSPTSLDSILSRLAM